MNPMSIRPVGALVPTVAPAATAAAKASAAPAGTKKPGDPALHRACEEFEASFVKQLLQAAKVGGKNQDHGYGAMAVDALASGIVSGGGLGLSRAIERALARQHEATAAPATATAIKPRRP